MSGLLTRHESKDLCTTCGGSGEVLSLDPCVDFERVNFETCSRCWGSGFDSYVARAAADNISFLMKAAIKAMDREFGKRLA